MGLRLLIAALLLLTAGTKLVDVQGFAAVVAEYRVLPPALVGPAAWTVALAELGLGVWLLSGWRLVPAALASVVLHATYMAWSSLALARGLALANCGCFGVYWARPLTWVTVAEDAVLTGVSLLLARVARR